MDKKRFVINFIAGPSVGKSLVSALVYAELKLLGYTTEYVQEYAKNLVWLKKWEKLDNQYLVTTKQYEMIKAVYNVPSIQYTVVDSSMLLCLYYNRINVNNVSNVQKTEEMTLSKLGEFQNIYIVLERHPEAKYEEAGRVQTQAEAKKVDEDLLVMLEELGIEYKSFLSCKESIPGIIEYITSF
jgi:hypothetical protein